ncbi:hypothetical protein E4K10_34005 [Streptomyces sp. T1317-0309]|nr:hypothetical protein E4K10_34005 [Streptomyces sp. T1317-0309]
MRRSAHVMSAAAAGAAPGAVAAPTTADPAARSTPRRVAPGGQDTVSVSCDAVGGTLPEFIDATSYAFDEDSVRPDRVGGRDRADGSGMQARSPGAVVYSGRARIPAGGTFRARIPGRRQTQGRIPYQGGVAGSTRARRVTTIVGTDSRPPGSSTVLRPVWPCLRRFRTVTGREAGRPARPRSGPRRTGCAATA